MAIGMFNFQDNYDWDREQEVGGDTLGTRFDPRSVDYGTIPSDLIRDEIAETAFIRDFVTKFKDKLEGKDASEYSEWIRVLGDYATGNAELSDLEAVDVSGLMDVEGFKDYYYGVVPRPLVEVSDEDAISTVLASVPDKIKGVLTEENLIKVLEQVGQMNDPLKEIKRVLGAGVSVEDNIFKDWEEWKVFGPLAIPGVPLPPGIIDVTLGEIAEAVQNAGEDIQGVIGSVGDFVNKILTDPTGTLEEIGKTILGKVNDVVSGVADDPWGGTFGGFEDWVRGILGNVVGGSVLTGIYDSAKDLIETGTTAVVGGADTEDTETTTGDPTTRFSQLLGTVEDNLAVDPDLFVGSVDTDDTTDIVGGDDVTKTITNLLGGTISQLDDDDDDDDITNTTTTKTTTTNGTTNLDPDITPKTVDVGGITNIDGGGTTTTEIGGGVVPESPVVIEPGGTDSSSGGGSVGGGDGMFTGDIRRTSYMPQVLPGVRVPPPIDSMSSLTALMGRMLTGRIA